MIVAVLLLAGFAAAFVLMLIDMDRLIAEVEFLDTLWNDNCGGGRASSRQGEATTPAATTPFDWKS